MPFQYTVAPLSTPKETVTAVVPVGRVIGWRSRIWVPTGHVVWSVDETGQAVPWPKAPEPDDHVESSNPMFCQPAGGAPPPMSR